MSEQNNVGLVRMGYDAFGRGDIDGLLNLLDDNVEWITPGPSDLPVAGTRRGRQAVGEFFKTLVETFETLDFQAKEFLAQGDRVVVLGTDKSRVRATGIALDFNWAHWFVINNEMFVNFREYGDMSAVVAELKVASARA